LCYMERRIRFIVFHKMGDSQVFLTHHSRADELYATRAAHNACKAGGLKLNVGPNPG
jgi:hypothetical protein